jgi:hypothetical protein
MCVSKNQPKGNEMLITEGCKLEDQNVHDFLDKRIRVPNKAINVNDILKDFKVNIQEVREYEKKTNKKIIRFGVNYDKRYKPFYQSILHLKEEHYFVYGLLVQFFRQNFHVNEKGEFQITYASSKTFQEYFEKNYQEEMKFIKTSFYEFPVTYEALYLTYLLLEENFVERYCLMYQYCLHRK